MDIFDAFISHASDDKEFVRPLVSILRRLGYRVWFDEQELRVGDSLRALIDNGLSKSRVGIVVLSPAYFRKKWTTDELDALIDKPVLPIWHDIGLEEIRKHSPLLASKVGINTRDKSLADVAIELAESLKEPMERTEQLKIEHLGGTNEAIHWLNKNVRNLRFGEKIVYRDGGYQFNYIKDELDQFGEAIRSALDEGASWRELFLPGQRDAYEEFYATLSPSQRERYQAEQLDTDIPLLQVIVLHYRDQSRCALFGFYYQGGRETQVFLSKDATIVRYFEDYLAALFRFSSPIKG